MPLYLLNNTSQRTSLNPSFPKRRTPFAVAKQYERVKRECHTNETTRAEQLHTLTALHVNV